MGCKSTLYVNSCDGAIAFMVTPEFITAIKKAVRISKSINRETDGFITGVKIFLTTVILSCKVKPGLANENVLIRHKTGDTKEQYIVHPDGIVSEICGDGWFNSDLITAL